MKSFPQKQQQSDKGVRPHKPVLVDFQIPFRTWGQERGGGQGYKKVKKKMSLGLDLTSVARKTYSENSVVNVSFIELSG